MRLLSPLRLLFDELLPWRVAAALRILEFDVTWVGHGKTNAPPRGSPDEDVLLYATRTNRKIVTSNHDMILLCNEQQRFTVWIDPWGRPFKREEMVLLVFRSIAKWNELLLEDGPVCVRALRTKSEVLTLEESTHLVLRRMKRRVVRQMQEKTVPTPIGPLFPPPSGQGPEEEAYG